MQLSKPTLGAHFAKVILLASTLLIVLSCNQHKRVRITHSVAAEQDTVPVCLVIDTMKVGEPYHLCEQVLTSFDVLDHLIDTTDTTYDREKTPVDKAFFIPGKALLNSRSAKLLGRRYNLAAVSNHVVHSYELFCRKTSERLMDANEDTTIVISKEDTLALIAEDIMPIPRNLLARALPDSRDRRIAQMLLETYARYDGNDEKDSPLSMAFSQYREYFYSLPELASKEMLEEFKKDFWKWYDKKPYVAEIDDMQTMRIEQKTQLSEEQEDHFKLAVESETDIDRRTILALEYAQWNLDNGAVLLGEILESGLYTKYLLEAWITWRACVQMAFIGPSSFCVIPNNYYDQMRVKCMTTMLRHLGSNPDNHELCMLENLVMCQILHRQASLMGNESGRTLSDLRSGTFVHPRVTESISIY